MTSKLSSLDCRLLRKLSRHFMFSAQLRTGSIYSGSLTDFTKRASTRIPEVSIFGKFWRRRATYHQGRLDIIPSTLFQQDHRRSARSFTHAGSQPSLASTILLLLDKSVTSDGVLRTRISTFWERCLPQAVSRNSCVKFSPSTWGKAIQSLRCATSSANDPNEP